MKRIVISDINGKDHVYPWIDDADADAALVAIRKAKADAKPVDNIDWLVFDGWNIQSAHSETKEELAMPHAAIGRGFRGRPAI